MLKALRAFSRSATAIAAIEGAAIGAALFPLLPEDEFDRQPIGFGEYLLVADIRLDNRDELHRALRIGVGEGRELADTELLARAWAQWGETALDRIVGDFAIAIYSTATRTLMLARDVTGQRPLFFADGGETISFASMPSGLLALADNRRGFDSRNIARLLAGQPAAPGSSYFRGIRQVAPGHVVTWRDGRWTSRRYWAPDLTKLRLRSDDDYVEAYREHLDAAVGARLRSSAPKVAIQLSSGFDSNAIAGTAARLVPPASLVALTSAPGTHFSGPMPRHRFADESAFAAQAASAQGIDHIVYRSQGPILAHLAGQESFYQDPYRNIVNMGWITALERIAAERGANAMLVGDLGNLTLNFGGLPVLADWVRNWDWQKWWSEARLAARSGRVRWRGILLNSFEQWLPEPGLNGLRRLFGHPTSPSQVDFLQPGAKALLEQQQVELHGADTAGVRWNELQTFDFGTTRKGSLGLTGVDTRDVMSDRRLIQFSLALPPDHLFAEGLARPLARRALCDRVPAAILETRDRGLQSADWYERAHPGEYLALVDEIAKSATVRELIDINRLRRVIANWPGRGYERFSTYQLYADRIPLTLATGLFLLGFEGIADAA